MVVQKPVIPASGWGAEAGGPGIPDQAKVHSKTLSQNKKEGVHITEDLITIFLGALDRGLRAPQTDTHQHPKAQGSYLSNSNPAFAHFHLCAAFRSQLMFALGGARSLFAGQSGNSEGRDRGQQKGNTVFSWRPAVTL